MIVTKLYTINEGTIEIPANLIDQSINVFATGTPNEFSMSITREEMPWGLSFEEYTLVQLQKLKDSFDGYTEVSKKVIKIGSSRSPVIRFHWNSPKGLLHQVVALIENNRHIVAITASFATKMTDTQYNEILAIFHTFQLKEPV